MLPVGVTFLFGHSCFLGRLLRHGWLTSLGLLASSIIFICLESHIWLTIVFTWVVVTIESVVVMCARVSIKRVVRRSDNSTQDFVSRLVESWIQAFIPSNDSIVN